MSINDLKFIDGICKVIIVDGIPYVTLPTGEVLPHQIDLTIEQRLMEKRVKVILKMNVELTDTKDDTIK